MVSAVQFFLSWVACDLENEIMIHVTGLTYNQLAE